MEIPIPEPLLRSLGGAQTDLSRVAFEAVIADQYRNGKLSHVEVSQLLGLDRFATDGFLKRHAAFRSEELSDYAEGSRFGREEFVHSALSRLSAKVAAVWIGLLRNRIADKQR